MVVRMAGGMHSADGSAFYAEDLTVEDGLLGSARRVFVDEVGEIRIELKEVGDAARMITVPVREQYVGESYVGGGERRGDQLGPFWDALTGIDEESFRACSYDIGVCALQCELAIL